MTCQEFDWKGFALDEITAPDRRRMEEHLLTCAACGEELESIRLTMTAMKRLPAMTPPPSGRDRSGGRRCPASRWC